MSLLPKIVFESNSFEKIRIIAAHHKTGSTLLKNIFNRISKYTFLKMIKDEQNELKGKEVFWFQDHSRINVKTLGRDYLGVHMIRNPYAVIYSGYRYHKKCNEFWCLTPREELQGKSYQEYLNDLSEEEGIIFEMKNTSYKTIMEMYNWNYNDKNFINVHLESIMENYDKVILNIFKHLGFRHSFSFFCLKLVQIYDISRMSDATIQQNHHITNKKRNTKLYKDHFKKSHYELFSELFPDDLFIKLGYEENTNI